MKAAEILNLPLRRPPEVLGAHAIPIAFFWPECKLPKEDALGQKHFTRFPPNTVLNLVPAGMIRPSPKSQDISRNSAKPTPVSRVTVLVIY